MKQIVIAALAVFFFAMPASADKLTVACIDGAAVVPCPDDGRQLYYDTNSNSFYFRNPGEPFPTFRASAAGKIEGRSLQLYEQGDRIDLNFGRAGPDNANPGENIPLAVTADHARLYGICGQTYVPGWDWGADDGQGSKRYSCVSEINSHADGPQTSTSRPGEINFRTTPPGKVFPLDRVRVESGNDRYARVHFFGEPGPASDNDKPRISIGREDLGFAVWHHDSTDRDFLNVVIEGAVVLQLSKPRASRPGESAFAIRFTCDDGTPRLDHITVGPANSAGQGHRMLMIENGPPGC